MGKTETLYVYSCHLYIIIYAQHIRHGLGPHNIQESLYMFILYANP